MEQVDPSYVPLRDSLASLVEAQIVAFMLLICDRMMVPFRRFSAITGYPVGGYQATIDRLWGSCFDRHDAASIERGIELEEPVDMDDFGDDFGSAALDAALAIRAVVDAYRDGDYVARALEVVEDVFDLIHQYVTVTMPESWSDDPVEWVAQPLQRAERARQFDDVAFVRSLGSDAESTRRIAERRKANASFELTPVNPAYDRGYKTYTGPRPR